MDFESIASTIPPLGQGEGSAKIPNYSELTKRSGFSEETGEGVPPAGGEDGVEADEGGGAGAGAVAGTGAAAAAGAHYGPRYDGRRRHDVAAVAFAEEGRLAQAGGLVAGASGAVLEVLGGYLAPGGLDAAWLYRNYIYTKAFEVYPHGVAKGLKGVFGHVVPSPVKHGTTTGH